MNASRYSCKLAADLSLIARKFQRNLSDYGFARTVEKSLETILQPFYRNRVYRLYRADLSKVEASPRPMPSLEFRSLQKTDRDFIGQIESMEDWLESKLEEVLDNGGLCLAALDGETVAGFNLISYRRIDLPAVRYRRDLPPRAAFSEQITVNKSYRGQGLGSQLRLEVFEILRSEGFRYFYGGTDVQNVANLALCRKVGLIGIADVHFRRTLSAERTIVRRAIAP